MNERIRKLLNEATSGLEPDLSEQRTVTLNEMEKFAKLIVRECMRLNSKELSITAIERLLPMYKGHFGVEE